MNVPRAPLRPRASLLALLAALLLCATPSPARAGDPAPGTDEIELAYRALADRAKEVRALQAAVRENTRRLRHLSKQVGAQKRAGEDPAPAAGRLGELLGAMRALADRVAADRATLADLRSRMREGRRALAARVRAIEDPARRKEVAARLRARFVAERDGEGRDGERRAPLYLARRLLQRADADARDPDYLLSLIARIGELVGDLDRQAAELEGQIEDLDPPLAAADRVQAEEIARVRARLVAARERAISALGESGEVRP